MQVEDMLHKMMRKFDAIDEYTKEFRSDLQGIRPKVDTHAISIKQLELQMAKLSVTVYKMQPVTLPRITVHNLKNDGQCMERTTYSGKQTIDQFMSSNEEKMIKDNEKVVEFSGEVED